MNYVQRLEHWGDAHHPKWIDLLRMILGVFLCIKGVEFGRNLGGLENLMSRQVAFSSLMLVFISHYILFAHTMGGFLLATGLLTRLACLIQIPVMMGAIIFVNAFMMRPFSELFLSILILLLLIYFLVVGSGPWSLDFLINKEAEKKP
ncbi:MAG: DoxX family protein [Flavisolibacter sp.]